MNPFAAALLVISCVLILSLSSRNAPIPFIIATCYLTMGQTIMLGPLHFTPLRVLIAVGLLRIILRGERPQGSIKSLDGTIILWGLWLILASFFHKDPKATFINHSGIVFDVLGSYILFRSFIVSVDECKRIIKILAFILLPVAVEMAIEQFNHYNFFSIFGGVAQSPAIRHGRVRSQGPFRHAILAGTVGAVCIPLMIGIWKQHRKAAKVGVFACSLMVLASASSGPLASLLISFFALLLWRWRHLTKEMRIAVITSYVLLEIVMKAPAYYIIARIDLAGGSTGWHRARLIEMAIKHLNEWWIAGTDYTRHWMPTGVSWSPNHIDITNEYIQMGVLGGLPSTILFIWILWTAFCYLGEMLKRSYKVSMETAWFLWCIGCSLLANVATMISVSYFDQSYLFLYLVIAMVGSLHGWIKEVYC